MTPAASHSISRSDRPAPLDLAPIPQNLSDSTVAHGKMRNTSNQMNGPHSAPMFFNEHSNGLHIGIQSHNLDIQLHALPSHGNPVHSTTFQGHNPMMAANTHFQPPHVNQGSMAPQRGAPLTTDNWRTSERAGGKSFTNGPPQTPMRGGHRKGGRRGDFNFNQKGRSPHTHQTARSFVSGNDGTTNGWQPATPGSKQNRCRNKNGPAKMPYIPCECRECDGRNRSVHIILENIILGPFPHRQDNASRIRWALAERFGPVEEVFNTNTYVGGRETFVAR